MPVNFRIFNVETSLNLMSKVWHNFTLLLGQFLANYQFLYGDLDNKVSPFLPSIGEIKVRKPIKVFHQQKI